MTERSDEEARLCEVGQFPVSRCAGRCPERAPHHHHDANGTPWTCPESWCPDTCPTDTNQENTMPEELLTADEIRLLPMDERIQIILTDALGEDDAANAYDAIKPLLREAWRIAHLCGVLCEREDVRQCGGNPFADSRIRPDKADS